MDRTDISWRGYWPAAPTPFAVDGDLDEGALRELMEMYVGQGVQGILVNGSSGEWFSQSPAGRRVRQIADRVAVMYLGRIVEVGATEKVWTAPVHPYTEALISAIPRADGAGVLPVDLPGDVPDPNSPPSGCRFHPRCPIAQARCTAVDPRPVVHRPA